MYSIDKIMQMLDSSYEKNNSEEVQNKGIELGKKVKFFDIFFQPKYPSGKMVWENCAKIICNRADEELKDYIFHLFYYLKDLTIPGALLIFERLKRMKVTYNSLYSQAKEITLRDAKVLNDKKWIENIKKLDSNYKYDDFVVM